MVTLSKNLKQEITLLLTAYPVLKDDDMKLISIIWYEQLGKKRTIDLQDIYDGKVTNPESIRRMRQKVQEENENLRGKNYKARQKNTKKIKEQLGY